MEYEIKNEVGRVHCIYCDSKLELDGKYKVCTKCKIIAFDKACSDDEIKAEILKYINVVKKKISQIESLHDIEQKRMDGKELTKAEEKIYDFCVEFRNVCVDIELYLNFNYSKKEFRMALHELYQLSKRDNILQNEK